ncbi:MAG: cysteine desulfurase [Clostridia bacterium]|nr:cysteine desulfurase [Clostridia bacterium]
MNCIYLDNSATTKPSEASLRKMGEALNVAWGNPSSVHKMGNEAKRITNEARKQIISALGVRRADDCRLIFTSGGTEANNLAIFGCVYAKERPVKNGSRGKILISDGEHSSVANAAKKLEDDGFTVLKVPTRGGVLDLDFIRENADNNTVLASFMLANNETGAIYDVKSAFSAIRAVSPKAVCHVDAVQAFLKTKFTPTSLTADAISVSAHKIFSPKGAGALCVTREMITAKRIIPIIYGGGQEDNYRSGTENVPAIAAFGAAAAEGKESFTARIEKMNALREKLLCGLGEIEVRPNIPESHLPNIVNITLPGIRSEIMLNYLSGEGICISAGSACSTHSSGPSSALLAYGLPKNEADTSVRISLSHENTEDEIDIFLSALKRGISNLARK